MNIFLNSKNLKIVLVAASLLVIENTYASGVSVIVNKSYRGGSVPMSDIKRIYLGKKRSLPGGYTVRPVDQQTNSPAYRTFYRKVVSKSASQLKSYWSKMIFSGKGRPPKTVGSDNQIKDWVRNNPGAIGYVSSSAVDSTVKVILSIR
ncbi:MAG: phosphate ABC transporter substrate-binding protein [Gammaproteobacteria bacterium]|nr:phosphate ABC transporter substrate-binding protein [Gammaproteobacteria bacterium]